MSNEDRFKGLLDEVPEPKKDEPKKDAPIIEPEEDWDGIRQEQEVYRQRQRRNPRAGSSFFASVGSSFTVVDEAPPQQQPYEPKIPEQEEDEDIESLYATCFFAKNSANTISVASASRGQIMPGGQKVLTNAQINLPRSGYCGLPQGFRFRGYRVRGVMMPVTEMLKAWSTRALLRVRYNGLVKAEVPLDELFERGRRLSVTMKEQLAYDWEIIPDAFVPEDVTIRITMDGYMKREAGSYW